MSRYAILGAVMAPGFQYPVPGPWSYNPSYVDDPSTAELYPQAAWGRTQSGQYGFPYAPYVPPFPTSTANVLSPTAFPAGYVGPQPIFVDNDDGTRTQVYGGGSSIELEGWGLFAWTATALFMAGSLFVAIATLLWRHG